MDSYSKRKYIVILIVLLIGFLFVGKLFKLQVVDTQYKSSATKNILRRAVDFPVRGLIYDRNGELLVFNQAAYDLMVIPREMEAFDTTELCRVLSLSKENLDKAIEKAKQYASYKGSTIVKQITPDKYALLQEKLYKYPGFYFQTRTLRSYNHNIAAHVLGYVREVRAKDVYRGSFYDSGDYYGDTGIEKAYEKELRGQKGTKFYLVDKLNRIQGSYEGGKYDTVAIKGNNLVTGLDYRLQEYGEKLLQNKRGSIVAIEPSTGEILAMVSTPGYKPNMMVGRNRAFNYPRLQSDTLLPLYNRALQAQYPPGSTFKMLNALIGLQEKVITPQTSFACHHGYHVGSFSQGCHHDREFTLTPSIAQSCNAYYAHTFRRIMEAPQYNDVRLAYDKWREHVVSMGFSKKLAHEFGEEKLGFIPTSDYYEKYVYKGSRWRALPIISIAIGQGEILTTPIQMANYAAILANRGFYYLPHVVKEIENSKIGRIYTTRNYTSIDSANYVKIIDGMEAVFSYEENGTARSARIPGIRMCGKTGTAENPHGEDHSIFIVFAPRENPKIALAVYIENGIWGSRYAAPISSLLVEKYLTGEIQEKRKAIEETMMNANLLYPDQPNYKPFENN